MLRIEAETHIKPDQPPSGRGSGYVVDCLISARLVIEAGSYENVVKEAILIGGNTDTTTCVSGKIAGIRYEVEAIPERWRIGLRGQELYEPLLQQLAHP